MKYKTQDDTFVSSIKIPHKSTYSFWTEEELHILYSYPELSAFDMAELLPGRTPQAIRLKRCRHGRWNHLEHCVCSLCHERVIWTDSAKASALRLCKGCYLKEMKRRTEEDRQANALRQAEFKLRRRKKADGE